MICGRCVDCKHNDQCRMVQEEIYEVGGKKTVVGVVSCDHHEKEQ